jgi:ABC-2 type transport system ATP-binding protein
MPGRSGLPEAGIAIEVDELTKRFGDFVAVDHVSFEVPRGRILGFLGPNGAGKSTTIRMLCGILPPSSGSAAVRGIDVVQNPEGVKEQLGYMSQKFSLYEDLTVAQNINFYGGIYRLPRRKLAGRRGWVIELAGLSGKENMLAGNLSVGVRQRLALGCALLHEPPILLLDEPTSGVDPTSRRSFWDLIHSVAREGHTVLVTTHYMDEAEYCDSLVLINRGRIVAEGTPEELKQSSGRGRIVDIRCRRSWEAADLLESKPGVKDVALYGAGLHVVVDNGGPSDEEFRDLLNGFDVTRVETVKASLEDVFVAMTRGEGD